MWAGIDLCLRFAFAVAVPFLLPIINLFMPITGMLIGTGIAVVVALIGSDLWHRTVDRIPLVGRILHGFGKLGDFYEQHPPKPLVYYLVYPLLLPVILFLRVPRREFFLFRRMNAIALVVIVVTGALDYFRHWRPELTFKQFAGATFGMMILQLIVTIFVIMPLVTTLVASRRRRMVRVLAALVVLMIASATYGAIQARKAHTMSIMTWQRLDERTKYALAELQQCEKDHPTEIKKCYENDPAIVSLAKGLAAAIDVYKKSPKDVDAQLEAARDKVAEYYKQDEADAFRVVGGEGVIVIFARYGRKPAIWLGFGRAGFFIDPKQLPADFRKLLGV